jgi:hypothetical protein
MAALGRVVRCIRNLSRCPQEEADGQAKVAQGASQESHVLRERLQRVQVELQRAEASRDAAIAAVRLPCGHPSCSARSQVVSQ